MPEALRLSGVTAGYGATHVLEGIDLALGAGESLSIIGRNGVGKSTLLATIMGHTTLHAGTIELRGARIDSSAPHRRALGGLAWVPQEREIFASLTVRENLELGARPGPWDLPRVCDLFPNLEERLGHGGAQLSGGEQQMLAIARALLTNPTVLLMDEPTEGLAPVVVQALALVLARLRAAGGLSIVLVEQNSRVALEFAERAVVMDRGRVAYDDSSERLRRDPEFLASLIAAQG
jgi:branched-chain amino acid transport system ATP-binding protein